MAKEGSTISGFADAFAQAISYALQYGVPLQALVAKFSHVRFEPSGMTRNPEIRFAKSIVDYIFRWMASKFLSNDAQFHAGVNGRELEDHAHAEAEQLPLPPVAKSRNPPHPAVHLRRRYPRTAGALDRPATPRSRPRRSAVPRLAVPPACALTSLRRPRDLHCARGRSATAETGSPGRPRRL